MSIKTKVASEIKTLIDSAPKESMFGVKCYISAISEKLVLMYDTNARAISQLLIILHKERLIRLSQADMIAVMDEQLLAKSEILHMNSKYHFIEV